MVLVAFVVVSGCSSVRFTSDWCQSPIGVDGSTDDWNTGLILSDDKRIAVGFSNDGEYLNMVLTTADRGLQRQITFRGLTVWFDYNGGSEKRFGIHYPVGGFPAQGFDASRRRFESEDTGSDTMVTLPFLDMTEVEMLGPMVGEHKRMSVDMLRDVKVRIRFTMGTMVYELRVPLTDNGAGPYAIGTKVGSVIGIGIETGTLVERGETTMGGRGMRPGREGGSRMGRGGERGGDGPGNHMKARSESLRIWATVHLSPGNDAAPR